MPFSVYQSVDKLYVSNHMIRSFIVTTIPLFKRNYQHYDEECCHVMNSSYIALKHQIKSSWHTKLLFILLFISWNVACAGRLLCFV